MIGVLENDFMKIIDEDKDFEVGDDE